MMNNHTTLKIMNASAGFTAARVRLNFLLALTDTFPLCPLCLSLKTLNKDADTISSQQFRRIVTAAALCIRLSFGGSEQRLLRSPSHL